MLDLGPFGSRRVVGHHHDGLAELAVQALEKIEHIVGRLPIELTGGQRVNIDIPLTRASAIVGRVHDEFGEPVTAARVAVLRPRMVNRRRYLEPVGDGDQTDDSASWAGAVYVLVRDELGAWSHRSYVKASNPDAFDSHGSSLSLSGDGHTLAVGAYAEGSAATGIGGDQTDDSAPGAGAVYLY